MKRRLLAVMLTAAMVAGIAAGCSTPGSSDSDSDSSTSGGEKVFRYSTTTEPTSLDPAKCNSIPDNEVQHVLTESLVRNTGGEVTPGIADEWEVSEDGLTYTFHIREDAKWSDGEPIKAEDFVYGWQRMLDPEVAAPYAFIGEYLKNGKEVENGEVPVEELGVKAEDDSTFVCELVNPTPYFLSLIGSQGTYAPARKDIVEKFGQEYAADAEKNVYSGPFVLESSTKTEYTFAKNENYWDADNIKLDKCVMNIVEQTDSSIAMYEDGELDYSQIPTAQVPNYEGQDNAFLNGNVDYFYINHESEYVSNKNFRLALNYALDRNSYNQLANNNVYKPSNGLVFTGLKGVEKTYGEEYPVDYSYPLDGDKDKAKECLDAAMKELGVASPSDITIEITTTDVESAKKVAEVVQDQWTQNLGINVEIRQVTYSEIYGEVLPKHDFQIGFGGWGSDYDDPYSYLELFIGDNAYNYSNYKNDEYDKLMASTRAETDAKKRMDTLAQAEKMVLEDGAFIPLQQREIHYMLNEKVTGLNFFYCSVNIDWVYADITE